MKSFAKENNIPDSRACAASVIDVVPLVMRAMRADIRHREPLGLAMAQIRVLTFIQCHAGLSLMALSEGLGQTASSASKQVELLVQRRFITRQHADEDRRRIVLTVTPEGEQALIAVREFVQESLSAHFTDLPAEHRQIIVHAMELLQQIWSSACCTHPHVIRHPHTDAGK